MICLLTAVQSQVTGVTACKQALSLENVSSGFPTWSDTNQVVQPQKPARGWKFQIYKLKRFYYTYMKHYVL